MKHLNIGTFLRLQGADGQKLARGLSQYAKEAGNLRLFSWDCTMWPKTGFEQIAGLDGIIAQFFPDMSLPSTSPGVFPPMVNVSACVPECSIPRICPDEIGIGEMVGEYFLSKGYRHFFYCAHPNHEGSVLRGRGFRNVAARSGCSFQEKMMPRLPTEFYSLDYKSENTDNFDWLNSLQKPAAIMCFSDYIASRIVEVCSDLGLSIPGDVAIIGVNNDEAWADKNSIGISSVDVGFEKVAYEALKDLCAHLTGATPLRARVIRHFKIIERESTDSLATDDTMISAAITVIHEHLGRRLRVDDVAKAIGASRRVLERHFRDKARSSVREMIEQVRLSRAKESIRTSDQSFKVIAVQYGFRDASHMSLVFKRRLGLLPSSYRKQTGRP